MANEIISLQNLQRFKSNCDGAYSGKLYLHTITLTITASGIYQNCTAQFTVISSKSTALTKSQLSKFSNKKIHNLYK